MELWSSTLFLAISLLFINIQKNVIAIDPSQNALLPHIILFLSLLLIFHFLVQIQLTQTTCDHKPENAEPAVMNQDNFSRS